MQDAEVDKTRHASLASKGKEGNH